MRGETWWENCLCAGAKNLPIFSTLFLCIPKMGRLRTRRSRFLHCAAHKGVSGSGRNDDSGSAEKRTGKGKGVEGYGLKGTDGVGSLSSSGSFAALRMTARTGTANATAGPSTALLTKCREQLRSG